MKRHSHFLLSKWYMDCVSDDGNVFIGYAATLKGRGVSINYSSVLQYQNNKQTEVTTSLLRFSAPRTIGSSLNWSSGPLGVSGTWNAIALPIKRTIFESDTGTIEWHCLQPLARAEVSIGTGQRLEGFGYAEHILISIPPWQLPIDELRWGRFLSNSDSLVWIDWRGPHPLTLLFHNDRQVEGALVTDSEVVFNDGRLSLTLNEKAVLREGPLIKTALSMVHRLLEMTPLRGLNTYECKWRARGSLNQEQTPMSTGWAIHEIVRWAR